MFRAWDALRLFRSPLAAHHFLHFFLRNRLFLLDFLSLQGLFLAVE